MTNPIRFKIDNLVLNGGSLRGASFIGTLAALEEFGYDKDIKRAIGSSAGALFAGLFACKTSAKEMSEIIYNTDFTLFMDGAGGQLGQAWRLYNYYGLYNGDYFYNWYGDILKRVAGDADLTFAGLYAKYNRELVVTGSNISTRQAHYFTKDSHPDMKVRDAVRISMSIPIFYVPVLHNGEYYVDGGYLDNFPMSIVDSNFFGNTVGFKLHIDSQAPYPTTGIADFIMNLLETSVEQIEKLRYKPGDELRTVPIHTFNIGATDFTITKQQIALLIDSGYKAARNYFDPEYKSKYEEEMLALMKQFADLPAATDVVAPGVAPVVAPAEKLAIDPALDCSQKQDPLPDLSKPDNIEK